MTRYLTGLSHLTALLLLSVFSRRLWHNLRFLRRARRVTHLPAPPRVSVLVPARNEAQTITACLDSLVQQDYPTYDILVLDDQSTDATGALLDQLAACSPAITVLHGCDTPPPGWNGKSYACQRLADRAAGEWLLFTDADTVHTAASVTRGMAQAAALNVDCLSAFPRQITHSWAERILVSFIISFLPLLAVDLAALWRDDRGRTVANGQYLLVRTAAYRAAGGHAAVASALVDDFSLVKHLRASGCRVALVDGTPMVSCRMYRNAREVWQGFSRNILLGLETSAAEPRPLWWGALFAWGYASVFVNPFLLVGNARQRWLPLLEIGWLGLLRGLTNGYLRRPLSEVLTTPLAAWGVMALALNALFRRRRGQPIRWKGREYTPVQ